MTGIPLASERPRPERDPFTLRLLTPSDAGAAAELIRMAFAAQARPTAPPSSALRETAESVEAKLAAGGGVGLFVNGELVALALWQADDDALMVGRVCALPGARGRGFARALIDACEAAARARGARRLRLRTRLQLPENEALFAHLGFARVRTEAAHAGFDAPTVAVLEKPIP